MENETLSHACAYCGAGRCRIESVAILNGHDSQRLIQAEIVCPSCGKTDRPMVLESNALYFFMVS